jgi:hypothetical protein
VPWQKSTFADSIFLKFSTYIFRQNIVFPFFYAGLCPSTPQETFLKKFLDFKNFQKFFIKTRNTIAVILRFKSIPFKRTIFDSNKSISGKFLEVWNLFEKRFHNPHPRILLLVSGSYREEHKELAAAFLVAGLDVDAHKRRRHRKLHYVASACLDTVYKESVIEGD